MNGAEYIKKLNIKYLLQEDKYIIPYYQRNFAWEYKEINQLLQDIYNFLKKTQDNYYLGTLVVAKKDKYEIVDGQQRHTILTIIHSVIGDDNNQKNIYFEARETNEKAIDAMFSYTKNKEIGSKNLWNARAIVKEFWKNLEETDKSNFKDAFYNKLVIYRIILPEKTDLNHYFEIMNNRGEQLEQHEILKSSFINKIKDENQRITFAKIWDACSEMDSHVVRNFEEDERTLFFGNTYTKVIGLEEILNLEFGKKENEEKRNSKKKGEENKWNFNKIITDYKLSATFSQDKDKNKSNRFESIIDFSNFLLQVLKLQDNNKSLDDKELLTQFNYPNLEGIDSMKFIHSLLTNRFYFDKYVIKREKDEKNWFWSLKTVVNNKNVYKVSFNQKEIRDKLIKQQSMFHVTISTKTYKNWLFEILKYFKENDGIKDENDFLKVIDVYVNNRIENLAKTNKKFYYQGLSTPRLLFNYIDYILWIDYYDTVRSGLKELTTIQKKIDNVKDYFSKFKFTQRNSIEHFMPQTKMGRLDDLNLKETTMNSIGNLCLISGSSNSSLNREMPEEKRISSRNNNINESLKQQIMFESFDKEWNTNEIKNHQKEIEALINNYLVNKIQNG